MVDENFERIGLEREEELKELDFRAKFLPKVKTGLMVLLIVVAGGFSGFFLAKIKAKKEFQSLGKGEVPKVVTKGEIVGSTDTETFRDKAVGVLERNEGDTQVEGTHKLIRDGPSQTAYLISSVIDLDQFVGRKVEIWGETFYSDKVGWLMDVGRLKLLE